MPAISAIPGASPLQAQLVALNSAIAALAVPGTTVPTIVISPAADPQPGQPLVALSIRLALDPPIARPTTLAQLRVGLQAQADQVTAQLVGMGYSDDTGAVVAQGPAPRPAA